LGYTIIGSGGTNVSIVHLKINSLGIRHQEAKRLWLLQVGALQLRGRRDDSLCADDQGQVADVLIVANHVVAGVEGRLRDEVFARRPTVSHEGSLSCRAPRRVPQRDSKASRMIQKHRQQPQLAREIGNYWDLTSALL